MQPISELEALIGVHQDPEHHPEGDAWTHTMLVFDAAASLHGVTKNPTGLMFSALCHNFGEAVTTQMFNGHYHAYPISIHAPLGAMSST